MGASPPKPQTKLTHRFAGGVSHHFNHFHAELAARPDSILLRKIREDSEARTAPRKIVRFSEKRSFFQRPVTNTAAERLESKTLELGSEE